MAMSEDDARTKYCPLTFARSDFDTNSTVSGITMSGSGPHLCVASQCMAWRWQAQGKKPPDNSPIYGDCAFFS